MVACKPSVRLKTITPALLRIFTVLEREARSNPRVPDALLLITSINDSAHGATSRHYRDEAVDVRSKSFADADKEPFRRELQAALGGQFTVLLESLGGDNEHFHVQVRKDHTYVPEG